ncbi:MAG: glycoside hydrolase [Actinobacteria bacterium]|nr:glycoside hydrolase [Actinomycetota bacterium]
MPYNVSVPFSSRGPTSIVLSRTTDLGQTFQSTVVRDNRPAKPSNNEGAWQPHVATDPKRNRVYVGWQRRNVPVPGLPDSESRPAVAVSTDGGKTFGPPLDLLYGQGDLANLPALGNKALPTRRGPTLAVAPDGTLFALTPWWSPTRTTPRTLSPASSRCTRSSCGARPTAGRRGATRSG